MIRNYTQEMIESGTFHDLNEYMLKTYGRVFVVVFDEKTPLGLKAKRVAVEAKRVSVRKQKDDVSVSDQDVKDALDAMTRRVNLIKEDNYKRKAHSAWDD